MMMLIFSILNVLTRLKWFSESADDEANNFIIEILNTVAASDVCPSSLIAVMMMLIFSILIMA